MTVYDLLAPVYGAWAAITETRAHRWAVAMVRGSPCKRLLEVGVGTGTEAATLAADPGREPYVGIDLSMNMLRHAQRRISHGAVLCQADGRALPFPTSAFDFILSCYTLDLLAESDITVVLSEFQRVLRTDGRLILVVMGHQAPIVEHLWMFLFRHTPALVGNCRPVDVLDRLGAAGWSVQTREQVSQTGFRSDVLLARPPQQA